MDGLRLYFVEAGWGIYPVLSIGVVSLATAIAHVRKPERATLALLLGLCAATLCFGLLGTVTGVQAASSYIATLSPDEKWIFLVGLREALNNLVVALVFVTVDVLLVCFALARSASASPARALERS